MMTIEEAKAQNVAICHEYCKPCEWYGVCPHSYAEWDAEKLEEDKKE